MSISAQKIWNQILERLERQLNRPTFETWIQTTTVKELKDNSLTLSTPNPFVLSHLQKHYLQVIGNVATDILGKPIEIHLTLNRGDNTDWMSNSFTMANQIPEITTSHHLPQLTKLNPKYTFYRFVVGPTNRMAHAAALAVAESPGRDFNPLFLCGGVGLGKTHLMQAIGHYHREISSSARVFYVSTEQFTNDLITAIRNDNMESFREYYRTADILLVDDIQFLEGKEYTQEEFFHTFNTLHEAGKQVVIASDRPPAQIPKLQERLISRFSMGLIADVQVPDLETRMAILQKKAEYENIRVPKDAIEYIATRCKSNIRELEGAFIRAIAYLSISGLPMTVDHIAPILNPPVEKAIASPEIVLQVVTQELKVALEDLKGASRRREISTARQIGMYLMRQHTDLSLPRIGEEFGGKDHTTVMYSCDKISKKIEQDRELNQTIAQLSDRINLASKQKEF